MWYNLSSLIRGKAKLKEQWRVSLQIYIIRLLSTYVKVAGTGLELELPLMAIALEKKKEEKKENSTMTSHITNMNSCLHLPREEEEKVIFDRFFDMFFLSKY